MSLGSELRQAREARGVTQAEAAEHVRQALALDGFSAKTISAQETDRSLPTKEALAVLAAYYAVGDRTAAAWEMQRVTLRRARKTSLLKLRLQGIAAGAPGGGVPESLFRPDDPAAEGVPVPDVPRAPHRDDRVTRADFARLVARIEAVLSELAGRPVNLSCGAVERMLRPVWRGLPWPVGARAGNSAARLRAGSQRPNRLVSLPNRVMSVTLGPSSPSRPGAVPLDRRYGFRA